MAYCTPEDVRSILVDDYKDTTDMTPFIAAADSMVVNFLVPLGILNTTTLGTIETWLAAHFYCIMRPRTNEEEADTIRDRFQSQVKVGLHVTHYGQMAMLLDPTGTLARQNDLANKAGKLKLQAWWLGKKPLRSPPFGWPPAYGVI